MPVDYTTLDTCYTTVYLGTVSRNEAPNREHDVNAKARRTRVRTERDVEVLRRTPIDPRVCCIKCYAPVDRTIYCDRCQPKRED